MFPISHLLVLSQGDFLRSQVRSALAGRGWGFRRSARARTPRA
jgi:hypothetical protein